MMWLLLCQWMYTVGILAAIFVALVAVIITLDEVL